MRRLASFARRWRTMPVGLTAALVALLLAAGIAVIVQGEAAFRALKQQEVQSQADILAASTVAAIDFDDIGAAQEAAEAMRVNEQVRGVAIFDGEGRRIAGYRRDGQPLARTIAESRRRALTAPAVVGEAPVMRGRERIGWVRVSNDPQPFAARLGRYLLVGLLVVMAALVVAVLGIAQSALSRANRELEQRAAALARSNAELEVQIEERAKAEEQLRQAQKMQALGQLTGGIAHDFNNLLTVIQGSADMLNRDGMSEERRRRYSEAIVQAAARAAELTGQLLAFARRQPLRPEVIDVNQLVRGMIELLDRTLGERIQVRTSLVDAACCVEADRAQLVSAVLNICVNARDAMPEGGTLTIATAAERIHGVSMISITVTDTGTGMDEETIERAMEPFFTTKSTGKGTGLGLSQVYGFATQSGGDLRIASTPAHGTTVTVLLPASDAHECEVAAHPAPGAHAARSGSVLLVEDNEEVGEFAEALLGELGYRVARARSGEEALALLDADRFDVILSDVVMPGISGMELAERIATARPGLPVLLTTGYSDEIVTSGAGGRPVILKPYRLETIAAAIDDAMGSGRR